jgi:hypothetical protein
MPRKLSDEELDAGRIAGLLKRADPGLWEKIKTEAESRGIKVSDYIVQLIRRGISYDEYEGITGRHIMQCMDILDRLYQYMHGWMSQTSLQSILGTIEVATEVTRKFAPALGFYSEEEVKKMIDEITEKIKSESIEKAKREGPLTKAFMKFVDSAAQEAARAIIEEAKRRGLLGEIANVIASEAKQALMEEGEGVGEGEM